MPDESGDNTHHGNSKRVFAVALDAYEVRQSRTGGGSDKVLVDLYFGSAEIVTMVLEPWFARKLGRDLIFVAKGLKDERHEKG